MLRGNRSGFLEQVRWPSPAVGILASAMDLSLVELVECSEGCGHRLYSDRGPVGCACHWPAAMVAQLVRTAAMVLG